MPLNRKSILPLSLLAMLWCSSTAFINPAFTPVDLVKQSDLIVELEIKNIDAKGMATATVTKVVKGKLEAKELKIDLSGTVPQDGQAVVKAINDGSKQAIFYVGVFPAVGEDTGDAKAEAKGLLHVAGIWVVTDRAPNNANEWDMDKSDEALRGTWSGATDMLVRATHYALTDPQADFPVKEIIDWDKPVQVGKIDGKVFAAAPVNVLGKGKSDLFVAAEKGDHLFRWNGKSFDDITAKVGITSKSQFFVWGDFNSDGRLDLASWNGKELSILSQGADGMFTSTTIDSPLLKKGCVGLTTFAGAGENSARPSLLASTNASPVVIAFQSDGSAKETPLVAGDLPAKDFGEPGECIVADFDNDGIPDIVQLFSNAGLFYKGTKPGEFAPPVKTAPAFGHGSHGSCIGDWDGSGTLDIFTCSEDGKHLWHNVGNGNFIEVITHSGSVDYISKAGGNFVQTSDFNNDGRQGLLMLYGVPFAPELYFNRGFRSFGLTRTKLEAQVQAVPNVNGGQQAGCLGDFTGIGAPSLALVVKTGDVWMLPRKTEGGTPLGVVVSLSLASPTAGPVTIWAGNDKRSFGAAVIRAGEPGFFYGVQEAGQITVKWRFPGGQIQQEDVVSSEHVTHFVIDKQAKTAK